jgi:hypothetical protein
MQLNSPAVRDAEAAGMAIVAADATEEAAPSAWSEAWPDKPGEYWFYGEPWTAPEWPIDRYYMVVARGPDGDMKPVYLVNCMFALCPEDRLCTGGLWQPVQLPTPPPGRMMKALEKAEAI